jgi:hypothetical protein
MTIIWKPIRPALERGELKDGAGFLAYGRHKKSDGRPGHHKESDHWWAIILWDIWREPYQWVFSKDGESLSKWGEPLAYAELDVPDIDVMHGTYTASVPISDQLKASLLDPLRQRMRGFTDHHDRLWRVTGPDFVAGMTDYNWEVVGWTPELDGIAEYSGNAYHLVKREFPRRGWKVEYVDDREKER